MLGKKRSSLDDVILISENEIRVLPISELTEEAVKTGDLTLPRADADVRYYPEGGRAFIFGWQGNYLAETENIAQLEKSVALKNMFNFGTSRSTNIQFYVLIVALIITVFLLRG